MCLHVSSCESFEMVCFGDLTRDIQWQTGGHRRSKLHGWSAMISCLFKTTFLTCKDTIRAQEFVCVCVCVCVLVSLWALGQHRNVSPASKRRVCADRYGKSRPSLPFSTLLPFLSDCVYITGFIRQWNINIYHWWNLPKNETGSYGLTWPDSGECEKMIRWESWDTEREQKNNNIIIILGTWFFFLYEVEIFNTWL